MDQHEQIPADRGTRGSTTTEKRDSSGKPAAILQTAADVTELKRTQEELASAREQLTRLNERLQTELAGVMHLHELSTRYVQRGDLMTVLDAILAAAIPIARADKGNIQLLNEESGELGVTTQRGHEPAFLDYFSHIRSGMAACGKAMETRKCVVVEDVTTSPLFAGTEALERMVGAGVRAVTCTPLLGRAGRVVGVLSTHFAKPHRPTDPQLRLLEVLSREAADFIEWNQTDSALREVKTQLSAANGELERINLSLEKLVEERTSDLRKSVDELEHFSYSITHDMRAPLRAMRSFATLLLGECKEGFSSEAREYLQNISKSAERMDHLIVDALDYTKAMREKMPLAAVDADALVRGVLESYPAFHPSVARIQIQGTLPPVIGNRAGLTQCISNLLENAVKFALPGQMPQVRIRAGTVGGGRVRLWFEDKGISIPKEHQVRIFEMFQRLNQNYEGTGIGLALVHKVMERMNGRVGVESEPGQGSRFWLELDAAEEAGRQKAA